MYKSKHVGMQTVSTNICEHTGRSQELSELQRGDSGVMSRASPSGNLMDASGFGGCQENSTVLV